MPVPVATVHGNSRITQAPDSDIYPGDGTSMRTHVVFLGAILLSGCEPDVGAGSGGSATTSDEVFAVVAEADRLAGHELWPGFDPRAIPVAIFDGERTVLFRHPAPPADFQALSGRDGVWTYPGRYPSVTANSSTEIGGVPTATLMPSARGATVRDRAGILIHEAFHVHQGEHHPGWQANEVEVFTYPVDDPGLLSLRRLETEALRRALAATRPVEAACWGRAALTLRTERFRHLSPGAAGYERATELYEGLAHYVEHGATGAPDEEVLPDGVFPPDAVRLRAYATGAAFARLLDRLSPSWKGALGPEGSASMDVLLSEGLGPPDDARAVCEVAVPNAAASRTPPGPMWRR